jgi:hypothetical protein
MFFADVARGILMSALANQFVFLFFFVESDFLDADADAGDDLPSN